MRSEQRLVKEVKWVCLCIMGASALGLFLLSSKPKVQNFDGGVIPAPQTTRPDPTTDFQRSLSIDQGGSEICPQFHELVTIPSVEVAEEAQSLCIEAFDPSTNTTYTDSDEDWLRIVNSLGAEEIVGISVTTDK